MRTTSTILMLILSAFFATGCDTDGPLENAAESINEAADEVGDSVENARNEIEDAAEELDNPR